MTALVTATVDNRSLDDAELEMFFFLLVIAGNDTVRSALPGGVLALVQHPQARRAAQLVSHAAPPRPSQALSGTTLSGATSRTCQIPGSRWPNSTASTAGSIKRRRI